MTNSRVRIFVSVCFGLLAFVMCVFWVRSFRTRDHVRWRVASSRAISISSGEGIVGVSTWTKNLEGVSSLVYSGPVAGSPPRRRMSNPLEFEFIRSPENDGLGVVIPYWFMVLSSAICAAIPQVLKSPRFGLRALIIATTLVALLLGLSVWLVR